MYISTYNCFLHLYNKYIRPYMPENRFVHTYHLDDNFIKIKYKINGRIHNLCLTPDEHVKKKYTQIISKLKDVQIVNYPIMEAVLNNDNDITRRLNNYIGHNGDQIRLGGHLQLKMFLRADDIKHFRHLTIITSNCSQFHFANVTDCITMKHLN